ncbi:hypothetical protein V6U81_13090 [Micromonospora sp. CPCC 205711]|uniref:hypothetical protein n=1 Tax=Micromonospora sp. CPCC 205547 TaxID=3122400 RepID=UPI002FF32A42
MAMILDELGAVLNSTDEWVSYEEPHEVFDQLDSRIGGESATVTVCGGIDA